MLPAKARVKPRMAGERRGCPGRGVLLVATPHIDIIIKVKAVYKGRGGQACRTPRTAGPQGLVTRMSGSRVPDPPASPQCCSRPPPPVSFRQPAAAPRSAAQPSRSRCPQPPSPAALSCRRSCLHQAGDLPIRQGNPTCRARQQSKEAATITRSGVHAMSNPRSIHSF